MEEVLIGFIVYCRCRRQYCETLQVWLGIVVATLKRHRDQRCQYTTTNADPLKDAQFRTRHRENPRRDLMNIVSLMRSLQSPEVGNSCIVTRGLGE